MKKFYAIVILSFFSQQTLAVDFKKCVLGALVGCAKGWELYKLAGTYEIKDSQFTNIVLPITVKAETVAGYQYDELTEPAECSIKNTFGCSDTYSPGHSYMRVVRDDTTVRGSVEKALIWIDQSSCTVGTHPSDNTFTEYMRVDCLDKAYEIGPLTQMEKDAPQFSTPQSSMLESSMPEGNPIFILHHESMLREF